MPHLQQTLMMQALFWSLAAVAGAVVQHVFTTLFGERLDQFLVSVLTGRHRGARPLQGTWRSEYQYRSDDEPVVQTDVHTVRIKRLGQRVIITSLPEAGNSRIRIECTFSEHGVLTGTWHEDTPSGRTYFGAVQLLLVRTGDELVGKYVGFSRRDRILAGDWTIRRIK
jgi:hypothetical protein